MTPILFALFIVTSGAHTQVTDPMKGTDCRDLLYEAEALHREKKALVCVPTKRKLK